MNTDVKGKIINHAFQDPVVDHARKSFLGALHLLKPPRTPQQSHPVNRSITAFNPSQHYNTASIQIIAIWRACPEIQLHTAQSTDQMQ